MRLDRGVSVVAGPAVVGLLMMAAACAAGGSAADPVASTASATTAPSAAAPASDGPLESVAPVTPDDTMPTDVEGSGEWLDVYEPVDLTGQLIIHTTAGAWVTPTDEGAVVATTTPQTVTVPTAWQLVPVGDRHQLMTVALTDGRPTCLSVAEPEAVGLEFCDSTSPAQLLRLEVSPTISSGAPAEFDVDGSYLALTDRGSLTTSPTPTGAFLLSAVAVPQP